MNQYQIMEQESANTSRIAYAKNLNNFPLPNLGDGSPNPTRGIKNVFEVMSTFTAIGITKGHLNRFDLPIAIGAVIIGHQVIPELIRRHKNKIDINNAIKCEFHI